MSENNSMQHKPIIGSLVTAAGAVASHLFTLQALQVISALGSIATAVFTCYYLVRDHRRADKDKNDFH